MFAYSLLAQAGDLALAHLLHMVLEGQMSVVKDQKQLQQQLLQLFASMQSPVKSMSPVQLEVRETITPILDHVRSTRATHKAAKDAAAGHIEEMAAKSPEMRVSPEVVLAPISSAGPANAPGAALVSTTD